MGFRSRPETMSRRQIVTLHTLNFPSIMKVCIEPARCVRTSGVAPVRTHSDQVRHTSLCITTYLTINGVKSFDVNFRNQVKNFCDTLLHKHDGLTGKILLTVYFFSQTIHTTGTRRMYRSHSRTVDHKTCP